MNLTKKQFSARKNKDQIYSIYEATIDQAYELAECYSKKVALLRNRIRDFQTGSHIWYWLTEIEKDQTSSFEQCAYLRCVNLKRTAFTVSLNEYEAITLDVQKLATSVGIISAALEFVNYLEQNELKVRAK